MAAIVKIDFKIGGDDAVLRSFKTILQASQAHGREQVKVAQNTAKAVAKATNDNGSAKGAAANYAREMREAKSAADKKIAEAKRAADGAAREAKRGLDKMASDQAKAERQKAAKDAAADNRAASRYIRDVEARERAEKRADTRRETVRRMEERKGQRISYAVDHARIDDINHRRGAVRGALGDAIKRGVGSGVGVISAAGAMAGGYLGTQTVMDAGRSQLDLGRRQALLENATGSKTDFVGLSKSISGVVGEDAAGIMGGFEKIAGKSGGAGLEEVKGHMLELAKIAKGAGVSMEDLGDVTATLFNRGIKGKDLANNIRMLVQQGKDGAVEFKDMATMLDASSGALLNFKMGASDRAMTAGGLSQIARTFGKKSAEESTNSVVDIGRDLGGKAKLIKTLSGEDVHVKGSKGSQMKDINELLPKIIAGMLKKGTAGKLMGDGGIFTGNATAIVNPLMQAAALGIVKRGKGPDARYGVAQDGETAEIKGEAAVKAMLDQFEKASMDEAAAAKAFARVMATQAEQINVSMNKLKNAMGDKLVPVLAQATPVAVRMIEGFGTITAWALSNPFSALGGIVLASVGKSLAGAGASAILDKILAKAIPNMNVAAGTVNVVGGPGAGGALGSLAGGTVGGTMFKNGLLPQLGAVGTAGAAAVAGTAGAALAGIGAAYFGSKSIFGDLDSSRAAASTQSRSIEGLSLSQEVNDPAKRKRAEEVLGQLKNEKSKGVIERFGEQATAGYRGIAKGEFSAGNIASLVPQIAMLRGVVGGGLETQQKNAEGGSRDAAISALEAALAKPRDQPDVVAAINGLGATIAASNLQGPKAPAP